MRIAGVAEPAACVFCDDSVKNIVAAKAVCVCCRAPRTHRTTSRLSPWLLPPSGSQLPIQRAVVCSGWRTVLVGKKDRDTGQLIECDAADAHIESLHELEGALPELFSTD